MNVKVKPNVKGLVKWSILTSTIKYSSVQGNEGKLLSLTSYQPAVNSKALRDNHLDNYSPPEYDRYRVPEFPHSSATFNIISGSHILASSKVLQGALGDSACPMQCSQPCPMPANRHPTGLTWFPIVLYYIK